MQQGPLERRNELAPIRAANRHAHIIRLKPSRAADPKDDYEKIEVRAQASYVGFSVTA
jgi:hypothetical protein